jgi:hypothetical protein
MNRGAHELDRYSEGDIIYAPNAPYEEERQHMNFSHVKYVVMMLTSMLALSYAPGYLSLGTQEWQPTLMQVDIVFPELINNVPYSTLFFGWDSIYYYEAQTSVELDDELFKTDLEESGFYYINLSTLSLIVFLLPTICCRKRGFIRLALYFISFLSLLFPIVTYIVNTKKFMEDFQDQVGQDVFYKLHIGYGFYANFLALLLLPVTHILMYVC